METTTKSTEVNQWLVNDRMRKHNEKPGIRIGDYILRKDNSLTRVTEDWGDRVQDGGYQHGRFYLTKNGNLRYSGSLWPPILKKNLIQTGGTMEGDIWIFHRDHWKAHNGVTFSVEFRIFMEK